MEEENVVISKIEDVDEGAPAKPPAIQPRLVDVEITDQNVALNLMVSFLNTAQSRGVYSLEESAKIWDCVKLFIIPNSA
jgi:hypothetical protein